MAMEHCEPQVEKQMYLVVDKSSHSFDLQHVGLMRSQLMHETVCNSVVPADTQRNCLQQTRDHTILLECKININYLFTVFICSNHSQKPLYLDSMMNLRAQTYLRAF